MPDIQEQSGNTLYEVISRWDAIQKLHAIIPEKVGLILHDEEWKKIIYFQKCIKEIDNLLDEPMTTERYDIYQYLAVVFENEINAAILKQGTVIHISPMFAHHAIPNHLSVLPSQ